MIKFSWVFLKAKMCNVSIMIIFSRSKGSNIFGPHLGFDVMSKNKSHCLWPLLG